MPITVEFAQKRQEEQARLGPLGIIGLNNRLATQTAIQRLTSKELFDPGYSRENAGSSGINTLMVGLGNKHHGRSDSGKDGATRQQFIQEIIDKGRCSASSSGEQNPTLYLAVPYITDQEAAQIARDTHREVCYTNTSLKLDIDIRGDLHLRPKIEGSMAFINPSLEKSAVP